MAAMAVSACKKNPISITKKLPELQYFFYQLVINSKSPCSDLTIGKVKHNINLEELVHRDECYHNESAYEQKLLKDGWSNNYTSPRSREIFDCHFIEYEEQCDGIVFSIKILFFSMKAGELLIPSIIKSDTQIITIIRNHIMIENNILTPAYHNYRIELLCSELTKEQFLDLSYKSHPTCKTPLYIYQRDSINRAIKLEKKIDEQQTMIDFTEHKLLFLDFLQLVFDYNLCYGDECFIKRDKLPKAKVYGGIIADEVGLGKTIQALNLALSREEVRTLIIVPNHIKDHWILEMSKHFIGNPFEGSVLIVSVAEAILLSDDIISNFQRLIVDELAELYAKKRPENHKLFSRLCGLTNFRYRWGITATPFIDDFAMFNILRFLLGNNKIHTTSVGNYTYIQEQFKPFFLKNIKANVKREIQLPDVIIHDLGLTFSEHEQAILDAMLLESETTKNIEELLRVISNAMLEFTNNDKCVITVKELQQLTLQRFEEKILQAQEDLEKMQIKLINIQTQIQEVKSSIIGECIEKTKQNIISQYEQREHDLKREIEISNKILERRTIVYKSYLEMIQSINEILQSSKKIKVESLDASINIAAASDTIEEDTIEEDTVINSEQMCTICYSPFTENIVLFIKCRHYFCQKCFEKCHKTRPNTCPMCRTVAGLGEINYIGIENQTITSTKNTAILQLLNTHSKDKFLIFTRFDQFIKPLTAFLSINGISAKTVDEYNLATPAHKEATRVILLSANVNASGTDMSYMHRIIIIEPFENYIYGKEIEKQLIGRLHRINQTRDVHVHRLFIKDTIEEHIYSL